MSDPLFPFGFGLSYSTFTIGTANINKTSLRADESVQLTVPVTNIGKRDGAEVLQVYVHKVNDIDGPLKTLKGYSRVVVPAGKSKQITIDLPPTAFEFYDWKQQKMAITPGEYEIYYGNSSNSNDLKTLKIKII